MTVPSPWREVRVREVVKTNSISHARLALDQPRRNEWSSRSPTAAEAEVKAGAPRQRAESPEDDSPGQSESASAALGQPSTKFQALKGRQNFPMQRCEGAKQ